MIPLFQSHYSVGRSILTLEPSAEIKDNAPVSIFSILKTHGLNELNLYENSFSGWVAAYEQSRKEKVKLRYGIKFTLCQDCKDKSEDSRLTESKIIVWMKNSGGYEDLVRLYSNIYKNPDNFYYIGRGDWKLLKENWTKNLELSIPFYDSFLFNNLMYYKHVAIPDFGNIEPTFLFENLHVLPFDPLILDLVNKYTLANKYKSENTHTSLYYKENDILAYQIFRIVRNRSHSAKKNSINSPNLEHFNSKKFAFETFLNHE